MAEHGIELKGSTFTLSVLHLAGTDPQHIRELLGSKVAQAPQFFHFAPLVLNVKQLDHVPDFKALKALIEEEDFVLVGISGAGDEAMKTAARAAGLAVMTAGRESPLAAKPETAASQPPRQESMSSTSATTRVHKGNVRSGQQIYAEGGSLVILGSVSHGAEVIADDSIHIYGVLRGRALAGARGNQQARIYCQHLEAELVSIAGTYQLSDALPDETLGRDVQIRREQEQIIFERLQS